MISPGIGVLDVQTIRVSRHGPVVLEHVPLVASDFFDVFSGWSYVVTPAFADRLGHFSPGRIWINSGPFLCTSSIMGLELSLDEVFSAVELIWFEFLPAKIRWL